MFHVSAFGDQGLRIQLGVQITPEINEELRSLVALLEAEQLEGVIEWIPTYTTITIFYNPYLITYQQLKSQLLLLQTKLSEITLPPAEVIHIPVCYGEENGPDLAYVANYNNLTEEEVISFHSNENYLIYMMGFTPGFPYLGGMTGEIATPRLEEPRANTPAGSVGIAEKQTGIYPVASPGGWRLIGRTPIDLFKPMDEDPFLLKAGDYIRFNPISKETFRAIRREVKQGTYQPDKELLS